MSLRVRLRFTKSLLRRGERLFFAIGLVCFGLCAAVLVHAWSFQAYENWAFEQQLRGESVSVREFLAETVSWPAPAAEELLVHSAAESGKPPTLGFHGAGGGAIVGRIEIPRIGLKAVILEGVAPRTLALAVGHIPGTALPGRTGNVGIAGHRDTFFRGLRDVRAGDAIVVTTLDGSYEYRVKSCEVVGPHETGVLKDAGEPALTLVTCYPFHYLGPAPERFIVHAERASL
jgi:LPXTG-site transpeptidase (sortase) family protein